MQSLPTQSRKSRDGCRERKQPHRRDVFHARHGCHATLHVVPEGGDAYRIGIPDRRRRHAHREHAFRSEPRVDRELAKDGGVAEWFEHFSPQLRLEIDFTGVNGQKYGLLVSSNLATWFTQAIRTMSGSKQQYIDNATVPQRFYRTVLVP